MSCLALLQCYCYVCDRKAETCTMWGSGMSVLLIAPARASQQQLLPQPLGFVCLACPDPLPSAPAISVCRHRRLLARTPHNTLSVSRRRRLGARSLQCPEDSELDLSTESLLERPACRGSSSLRGTPCRHRREGRGCQVPTRRQVRAVLCVSSLPFPLLPLKAFLPSHLPLPPDRDRTHHRGVLRAVKVPSIMSLLPLQTSALHPLPPLLSDLFNGRLRGAS